MISRHPFTPQIHHSRNFVPLLKSINVDQRLHIETLKIKSTLWNWKNDLSKILMKFKTWNHYCLCVSHMSIKDQNSFIDIDEKIIGSNFTQISYVRFWDHTDLKFWVSCKDFTFVCFLFHQMLGDPQNSWRLILCIFWWKNV